MAFEQLLKKIAENYDYRSLCVVGW
jgi:hypothetical protein